jgi:D-alanyl-D-alanine carboxypeptidase
LDKLFFRKLGLLLVNALIFFGFAADPVWAEDELDIRAEAAILIDAKTGTVVYEKNADEPMYPASITKIVTGIVAIQSADLNESVTVSKEARHEEGTRVFLAEGEVVTVEKLLYGMLVNSGNDAATALAEHIDGTKEQFAERMNDFVRDTVGVKQTHFTNPHGLPDPEHYTTAHDMAMIARYAMQNELFREIVATKTKPWVGEEWESELMNHNRLLWTYEGANGIKNGFTSAAGFTLVSSAKRGDTEYIGVILKASSEKELYDDMTALLDYGFQHFESRLVMDKGEKRQFQSGSEGEKEFVAAEPVWATLPKAMEPVATIDEQGRLHLHNSPLVSAAEPIAVLKPLQPAQAPELPLTVDMDEVPQKTQRKSPWAIAITAVWFLQLVFLCMVAAARRRKMKRRSYGQFYKGT